MSEPITVVLTRPITVDGTTYNKLVFDEPDLDAQINYAELEAKLSSPPSAADGGKILRFWVAHLADVPKRVAGKIKDADIAAIEAALNTQLGIDAAKNGGDGVGNEIPEA